MEKANVMTVRSSAHRSFQFVSIVLLFGCAIFYVGNRDFGYGVDGGTHYFFADQLAQNFTWPFAVDPEVGFLAHYPPAAHFLAAVIGKLVGSTLHGMLIVTAIAVACFYLILAELVQRLSPARSIAYLSLFLVFSIIFRKFRFVFGNEVILNFFFAQFAATAVQIGSFYLLSQQLHRSFGMWLAISAIAVHLTGWFYPLSAIQLAIAVAVLRAIPTAKITGDVRQRVFETVVAGFVLCAVAVIHPTMLDMIKISANDGATSISNEVALCIVIFAALALVAFYARFYGVRSPGADALIAFSVGVTAPCVMLGLLLVFGKGGSLYAVKKSLFLIGTLTMMLWAVLIVDAAILVAQRLFGSFRGLALPASAMMPVSCLFAAACLPAVYAGRPNQPIDVLQFHDSNLRQLLAQAPSGEFYGRTALINAHLSPTDNYLIGYPVLRQIRLLAQESLFDAGKPDVSTARYIVVNAADGARYDQPCIVRSSSQLAIVKSECFTAMQRRGP